MAFQVVNDLIGLVWRNPFVSCLILLLFTPPFFPVLKYFSPLLISTGLFMLLLFTLGPKGNTKFQFEGDSWKFERVGEAKAWEDKDSYERDDCERLSKRRKSGGGLMGWVKTIQESGSEWVDKNLRNEESNGSTLNDQNVHILQEAFPQVKSGPSTFSEVDAQPHSERASMLVRQESLGKDQVSYDVSEDDSEDIKFGTKDLDMELGEDGPEVECGEGKVATSAHQPAVTEGYLDHAASRGKSNLGVGILLIPPKTSGTFSEPSPETEIDDTPTDLDKTRGFQFANVRRNSVNANSASSMESDFDSPEFKELSKSGKLRELENLVDYIEKVEQNPEDRSKKSPLLGALKPTSAEEVESVKEKLEHFVLEEEKSSPDGHFGDSSPGGHLKEKSLPQALEKPALEPGSPFSNSHSGVDKKPKMRNEFSSDESSSGEEELSDSESDSDEEISPPVRPLKTKLHPSAKLDAQEVEKRMGNQLTKKASSPGGEITEVH